ATGQMLNLLPEMPSSSSLSSLIAEVKKRGVASTVRLNCAVSALESLRLALNESLPSKSVEEDSPTDVVEALNCVVRSVQEALTTTDIKIEAHEPAPENPLPPLFCAPSTTLLTATRDITLFLSNLLQ